MQDQRNNSFPPFLGYNHYGMNNNYRYNNYTTNSAVQNQDTFSNVANENCMYNNSFNDINYVSNVENSRNVEDKSETREFFEIFGLKLYFDDILLICLIFFLYKEDVHDEMLFIALVLLLLS